eukprot:EC823780.1.p1 GENE.EC823780.1~~EC823780.1.p1  ORF type:complete len:222 (+),score=69.63 EC823780.1:53-667(+)
MIVAQNKISHYELSLNSFDVSFDSNSVPTNVYEQFSYYTHISKEDLKEVIKKINTKISGTLLPIFFFWIISFINTLIFISGVLVIILIPTLIQFFSIVSSIGWFVYFFIFVCVSFSLFIYLAFYYWLFFYIQNHCRENARHVIEHFLIKLNKKLQKNNFIVKVSFKEATTLSLARLSIEFDLIDPLKYLPVEEDKKQLLHSGFK